MKDDLIADAITQVADSIACGRGQSTASDPNGGYVASLTEAALSISFTLDKMADAINAHAQAMDRIADMLESKKGNDDGIE